MVALKVRTGGSESPGIITQKTLSAKLQLAGYDFNDLAILRIEQGTRFVPDYEVVALAEVFNVSCEYLLGLTDAPAK